MNEPLYLCYGDVKIPFDLPFSTEVLDNLMKLHGGEIISVFEEVISEYIKKELPDVVHELVARVPKMQSHTKDEEYENLKEMYGEEEDGK